MKCVTWLACLALPLLISLPLRGASAQSDAATELELPGLQSDADAFTATLRQAYPGGASKDQLQRANAAAEAAVKANDWQKALPALETMVGGVGQDTTADWQTWLALGVAEAKAQPPNPERSLQAAWMAFTLVDSSSYTAIADEVTALHLMDAALTALNRPLPEVAVLQAIARRLPGDHAAQQAAVQRRDDGCGVLSRPRLPQLPRQSQRQPQFSRQRLGEARPRAEGCGGHIGIAADLRRRPAGG
jgi:hypothetical protein